RGVLRRQDLAGDAEARAVPGQVRELLDEQSLEGSVARGLGDVPHRDVEVVDVAGREQLRDEGRGVVDRDAVALGGDAHTDLEVRSGRLTGATQYGSQGAAAVLGGASELVRAVVLAGVEELA